MSDYVKTRYAIESRYVGKDPPWQGWKVTRTFPCAESRDNTLRMLLSLRLASWQYRIKR